MLVIESAVRNQDGLFSPCSKVVLHILRLEEVFLKAEVPGPDPKPGSWHASVSVFP